MYFRANADVRNRAIHWLGACLMSLTLAAAASAQSVDDEAPFSAQELATIEKQRSTSIELSTALQARLSCLQDQDDTLDARSRALQAKAGELHDATDDLEQEFNRARSQRDAFAREFDQAQDEMNHISRQMQELERQLSARQLALEECKKKTWILGFMCDFAGEITGLNQQIRQLQPALSAHQTKFNGLKARQAKIEADYRAADNDFAKVRADKQANEAMIASTEAEIKVLKRALETLRSTRFTYASEQKRFESAYADFKGAPDDDDPAFARRNLRDASADLAEEIPRARAVLNDGGVQLPSGARVCSN